MPTGSVTLGDAYDPGERALTGLWSAIWPDIVSTRGCAEPGDLFAASA
jgi:hypothetical protein